MTLYTICLPNGVYLAHGNVFCKELNSYCFYHSKEDAEKLASWYEATIEEYELTKVEPETLNSVLMKEDFLKECSFHTFNLEDKYNLRVLFYNEEVLLRIDKVTEKGESYFLTYHEKQVPLVAAWAKKNGLYQKALDGIFEETERLRTAVKEKLL